MSAQQPEIEFSCGFISKSDKGYIRVRMKDGSNSTIASVKESQLIMNEMQLEGNVYILALAGYGSTSDDDIYDFISKGEFTKRVKAQAIVVHDLATRLMGNLFVRYIKKHRNIKMFSSEEQAVKWLISEMK